MAKQVVVALTGGPCAGKTTILSVISQKAANMGWAIYFVQEAATRLIEQGMKLKEAVAEKNRNRVMEYEEEIIRCSLEDLQRMKRCAALEDCDALIVCDRGIPDVRAYLPMGEQGDQWYRLLLAEVGLSESGAFALYDGVIKLTTAADGAEAFYTLANNKTRDEPPDVARQLDKEIERAYLGHLHLRVVDNSTDFEGKKFRALREIFALLGVPVPYEIERKYRVALPSFSTFPVPYRMVDIEQSYLVSSVFGEEIRVRRRTIDSSDTYYLTKKKPVMAGKRIEIEEMIGWRQYLGLCALRDPECGVIKKKRYCFLWEGQYFELDVFQNPSDICVLEVELTDLAQAVTLPPFLDVKEDVTESGQFNNHTLALLAL